LPPHFFASTTLAFRNLCRGVIAGLSVFTTIEFPGFSFGFESLFTKIDVASVFLPSPILFYLTETLLHDHVLFLCSQNPMAGSPRSCRRMKDVRRFVDGT